ETGIDQHGSVGLGEQIAVRHRKSARAQRIGAHAPIERVRVLQGIQLAGGKRGDGASSLAADVSFADRVLSEDRHGGLTLPGLCAEVNSSVAWIERQRNPGSYVLLASPRIWRLALDPGYLRG